MYRFAAPFVGLAAVLASPAQAQSAAPPQTPSAPNRALSDVEAGGTWLGWGNTNFSVATDCSRIVSVQQGLLREANAYQRLGEGFGNIGRALTVVTAMAQAGQGNYLDATQTMGEAAFDKALCWLIPVAACAGWNAGRAVGATIKMMPWPGDSQGRTIGDVVMDKEVEWLVPYLDQPMNVRNMEAAFSAFQRKQAEIRAAQERARQFAGQCSMNNRGHTANDVAGADDSVRQSTSFDRAMATFRNNGGNPNQSWSGDSGSWSAGQSAAPAYSPPPVQQPQSNSSSGFDWGQAVGAALTGYALGQAINGGQGGSQGSETSKGIATPAPQSHGYQCDIDPSPGCAGDEEE